MGGMLSRHGRRVSMSAQRQKFTASQRDVSKQWMEVGDCGQLTPIAAVRSRPLCVMLVASEETFFLAQLTSRGA